MGWVKWVIFFIVGEDGLRKYQRKMRWVCRWIWVQQPKTIPHLPTSTHFNPSQPIYPLPISYLWKALEKMIKRVAGHVCIIFEARLKSVLMDSRQQRVSLKSQDANPGNHVHPLWPTLQCSISGARTQQALELLYMDRALPAFYIHANAELLLILQMSDMLYCTGSNNKCSYMAVPDVSLPVVCPFPRHPCPSLLVLPTAPARLGAPSRSRWPRCRQSTTRRFE